MTTVKREPGKGERGGECNRTVCHQKNASFFNHSTRKYYCGSCATMINRVNHNDAMHLYGHELCTLEEKPENRLTPPEDENRN